MSEQGERGERGPKGDHGQHGEPGDHGERGARGAQGVDSPLLPRRLLVLFITMMLVFGLLAWRGEHRDRQLEALARDARAAVHEQCDVANQNATNLNKFIDSIIVAVQKTPSLTAEEKARRVASYVRAKAVMRDCT